MKITFLGTGTSQGIPVIACSCPVCQSTNPKDKRLRCALKIDYEDKCFVIDVGPDFRQQMLRSKTPKVDALLITHEHRDHIGGLDEVRSYNFKHKMEDSTSRRVYIDIIFYLLLPARGPRHGI